jgi:hypothetical protein
MLVVLREIDAKRQRIGANARAGLIRPQNDTRGQYARRARVSPFAVPLSRCGSGEAYASPGDRKIPDRR